MSEVWTSLTRTLEKLVSLVAHRKIAGVGDDDDDADADDADGDPGVGTYGSRAIPTTEKRWCQHV